MCDKIESGVGFDALRDIDEHIHVHAEIGKPVNPATILSTQDRGPGEECFVEVGQPCRRGGNITVHRNRGIEQIVKGVLPNMIG